MSNETLGMIGTLPELMRQMPTSLNDACRTLEAGADEIDRLRLENLELAKHIDGCVRVAADALKRAEVAEAVCRLTRPDVSAATERNDG